MALALGMSVARAREEIDAQEFRDWMAYERIEPFGPRRDDLRIAMLAALYANQHRRRGSRPVSYEDYMPRFKAPSRRQSQLEIAGRLNLFFSQFDEVDG